MHTDSAGLHSCHQRHAAHAQQRVVPQVLVPIKVYPQMGCALCVGVEGHIKDCLLPKGRVGSSRRPAGTSGSAHSALCLLPACSVGGALHPCCRRRSSACSAWCLLWVCSMSGARLLRRQQQRRQRLLQPWQIEAARAALDAQGCPNPMKGCAKLLLSSTKHPLADGVWPCNPVDSAPLRGMLRWHRRCTGRRTASANLSAAPVPGRRYAPPAVCSLGPSHI